MNEENKLNSVSANSFHLGGICPYCQHQIELEQSIVLCNECRSWQHSNCWTLNKGCSSYHCDKKTFTNVIKSEPEFTITAEEVEKVKYVPIPVRRISSDLAKDYIPEKPSSISKLALTGFILAILNLISIVAIFKGNIKFLAFAVFISFISIIIAVISVIIINNGKKYGYIYASSAILLSAFFIVICTARVYVLSNINKIGGHGLNANFNIEENLPKDEELDRLRPERAQALRANVVIKCTGDPLLGSMLGSGIVIKKTNQTAFLLTNKHVIENAKSMEVTFYNGEVSEGHLEWQAPKNIDLAIISCSLLAGNKIQPVNFSPELAGQSQSVFAVGNPMNLLWSYTEGVISSRRIQNYDGQEVSIYQTQTPINSGNSGGGLYNQNGLLIGVNTWTQNKALTEGLNFSISSSSIISILKSENKLNYITIFFEVEAGEK